MSPSIEKVVVATDFSMYAHRAALRAGKLAKQHGASLRLLHVLNRASMKALQNHLQASPPIDTALAAEARQRLESLAADVVAADGVAAECAIEEGEVIDTVLAAAKQADLLVLGPRGLNPTKDLLLGSTAERIARRVQCPLLVARQEAAIAYDSVLVAVDFCEHSLQALRFARALAPRADLHVLHAYDNPFKGRLQTAGVSDDAVASYSRTLRLEAEAEMREFLAQAAEVTDVRSHIEFGDPRQAICSRASEHGHHLIVLGKQGRSWWSELLLGSLARRTLELAPCDVAIVPSR